MRQTVDFSKWVYRFLALFHPKTKYTGRIFHFRKTHGKLPKEVNNLFKLIEIKILCWKYNIETIEFSRKGIVFSFYLNKPPNPENLMKLGFAKNNQFSIRPDQKIFYDFMGMLNEDRFILTKKLIDELM